ncbi:hypothetical protein JW824_13510 [bacterium]|nr:hypothetical protein [bacterium]
MKIVSREPKQFELINFLPFVLWLGLIFLNESDMWSSSAIRIIYGIVFFIAFFGISISMILRKGLHKGLIVLVIIPFTAIIMYVILLFMKPRNVEKNIHQVAQ